MTPYAVVALLALVLAAWELGRRSGIHSSRSTLGAARSVMEAATATSSMAVRVTRSGEAVEKLQATATEMLAESTRNREATETLIEMVKAELMAEITQGRNRRREAVPERSPLPSIPLGGQSLWGPSTTSGAEPSLDAPTREPDRPT